MSDFQFGVGPKGPWVDAGFGRLDVTDEQLAEVLKGQGVVTVAPEPFRPRMTLGFNDCDPVAVCDCGARCVGKSINDAALAWAGHLAAAHKGEW